MKLSLRGPLVNVAGALALAVAGVANAEWSAIGRLPTDRPELVECVERAAKAFQLPEVVLWVLLDVEGGTVGKTSKNTDGSYDISVMQVNSWWLPTFARMGVTERMLLHDLCVNVYAGAWIYRKELNRHRDYAKAIASYHSPTPRHQKRYLGLAKRALERRMAAYRRADVLRGEGKSIAEYHLGAGQG